MAYSDPDRRIISSLMVGDRVRVKPNPDVSPKIRQQSPVIPARSGVKRGVVTGEVRYIVPGIPGRREKLVTLLLSDGNVVTTAWSAFATVEIAPVQQ